MNNRITYYSIALLLLIMVTSLSFELHAQCNALPNASTLPQLQSGYIDAANPTCVTDANTASHLKAREDLTLSGHQRKYVANIRRGDKLEYELSYPQIGILNYLIVNIRFASKYDVKFKMFIKTTAHSNWMLLEEANGQDKLLFPSTGGWRNWERAQLTIPVQSIAAIKFEFTSGKVNFNTIDINSAPGGGASSPSNSKVLRPRSTSRIGTFNTDDQRPIIEELSLTTYPNPATNQLNFNLNLPTDTHAQLYLYNAIGQRVKIIADEQLVGGQQHQLQVDVSDLKAGMYFYRLETDHGEVMTGRVVIE